MGERSGVASPFRRRLEILTKFANGDCKLTSNVAEFDSCRCLKFKRFYSDFRENAAREIATGGKEWLKPKQLSKSWSQ